MPGTSSSSMTFNKVVVRVLVCFSLVGFFSVCETLLWDGKSFYSLDPGFAMKNDKRPFLAPDVGRNKSTSGCPGGSRYDKEERRCCIFKGFFGKFYHKHMSAAGTLGSLPNYLTISMNHNFGRLEWKSTSVSLG